MRNRQLPCRTHELNASGNKPEAVSFAEFVALFEQHLHSEADPEERLFPYLLLDNTEVCEEVNGFCAPANYNSPQQTVIAGESAAIDEAVAKFAEMGKRAVKLSVSAAFHTKLMAGAAEKFKGEIAGFPFKAPNCDFYSNLYGRKLDDFSDMPSYLAAHICSPVKFVDELTAMQSAGIETYVELGSGKVLTGLVKKFDRGANAMHIENAETLEKALTALKG